MKVYNCSRCGRTIEAKKSNEIAEVKCPHCNKEFKIDAKTRRYALFIVILLVFGLALFTTLLAEAFKISPYILLIPMMLISIFLYRYALWILAKLNKVSYEEK